VPAKNINLSQSIAENPLEEDENFELNEDGT
jgi:hypothetical protein